MGIYNDDIVTVPKEFSFSENIRYMLRSTNECMYEIQDEKITKVIPVTDVVQLVEISENVDGNIGI